MFVLDTNVISELRKVGDGKADARVAAWVSGFASSDGIRSRGKGCGPGWTGMYYPNSWSARCRSIPLSP